MPIQFRRLKFIGIAATAITGLGVLPALADYPERPISLMVASAPGSGGDVNMRTYVPFLEKCLGPNASVVVVNKPGAGGAIASGELLNAAPDGYTFSNLNMPNTAARRIADGEKPPYEDFDYIASVTSSRVVLAVAASSEFNTLEELIAYAKENPKVLTLGLSSLSGDDHLTQLQLMKESGIELTVVPFGDGGSSRAALLGGHVSAASMSDGEAANYLEQLRPLAIGAEERSAFLPDVPTMRELGFDVIGGSDAMVGAPKGVAPEILEKVRGCYGTVFSDPEFLAVAKERSVPVFYRNSADTEAFVREQTEMLQNLWATNPWVAQ